MTPEIFRTADGSDTLYNRTLEQHYHSTFGAIQESQHIFIEQGLLHAIGKFHEELSIENRPLNILEIGFGTGLNALLTLLEAERLMTTVAYTTLEAFPLDENTWKSMNYPHILDSADHSHLFGKLHLSAWNTVEAISLFFSLLKIHGKLENFTAAKEKFHLVYFDAFGPDTQPELWTIQIFQTIFDAMAPGAMLVTYSVKGTVVRALRLAGFSTEKLPGPPGKRHILRAVK